MKLNAREKNIANAGILGGLIAAIFGVAYFAVAIQLIEFAEVTYGTGYGVAVFLGLVLIGLASTDVIAKLVKDTVKGSIEEGDYKLWKKDKKGKRKKCIEEGDYELWKKDKKGKRKK